MENMWSSNAQLEADLHFIITRINLVLYCSLQWTSTTISYILMFAVMGDATIVVYMEGPKAANYWTMEVSIYHMQSTFQESMLVLHM